MQQEHIGSIEKEKQVVNSKCAICNKIITSNDLVTIGSSDNESEAAMHFNCYLEIHEKICAECGIPFKNQEKVWYCEEHREYLHIVNKCILKHLSKHVNFKEGVYDSTRNRVTLLDNENIESIV